MTFANLEKLYLEAKEIAAAGVTCDFTIANDNPDKVGHNTASLVKCNVRINSFATYRKVINEKDRSTREMVQGINSGSANRYFPDFVDLLNGFKGITAADRRTLITYGHLRPISDLVTQKNVSGRREYDHEALRKLLPTVKFFPTIFNSGAGSNILNRFCPLALWTAPIEVSEKTVTYRVIYGQNDACGPLCVTPEDQVYQYLDKGFIFLNLKSSPGFAGKNAEFIICSEVSIDTLCCMMLIYARPSLADLLPYRLFLAGGPGAKVMRARLEKEAQTQVSGGVYREYEALRTRVLQEFENANNQGVISNLLSGSIGAGTFNGIKLTPNSAQYETVKIEAPDLLKTIAATTAFDDGFDIYTAVNSFLDSTFKKLESAVFKGDDGKTVKLPDTVPVDENAAEVEEPVLGVKKPDDRISGSTVDLSFVINGINITFSRTTANTRRYINGVAINKDEMTRVAYRACCFSKQEDFDAFLQQINEMSLEWHDHLGNGFRVKINDNMSDEDFRLPEAPLAAPRLRFKRDGNEIHILIGDRNLTGENESYPIRFANFIHRLRRINRLTTNTFQPTHGYGKRNAVWARRELTKAIIDCCTFEEKVPLMNEKGEPVLGADGKQAIEIRKVCKIPHEKAAFVEETARIFQERAIQREKEFLEKAVKATEAELKNIDGHDYYIVKGSLRSYRVCPNSNKVYEHPSGRHICVVEPGHKITLGGDATAARLYALRNDKMLVSKIQTLAH